MQRRTIPALAVAAALAAAASARAQDQSGFPRPSTALQDESVMLVDGYTPYFSQKKAMNRLYGPAYDELHRTILDRQSRGETLACSSQVLTEVGWLIQYTGNRARIDRRLADLRRSLDFTPEQQRAAQEQSPDDGSWGHCYEEWFLRVYASADPIKALADHGRRATRPLKFLDKVNTPDKILSHMRSLLLSHTAENGRNNRKELNLTIAGLAQILLLPELASQFDPSWRRGLVARALTDFMDREWQDTKTGYWGSWYDIDGKVVKTEDLSMTFHIASYRNGNVPRLHELVRTTLRIRDRRYPFGWHDRGTQNNHHAYDVVRLLRLGWPYMTDDERSNAWAEILIIMARARRLSLNSLDEFDTSPYSSFDEAYYFGVSLFDELGYFRPSRRFWALIPMWRPDDSEELRRRLLANIDRSGIRTPMMMAARRKLMRRD